jgi:hypothetical protein
MKKLSLLIIYFSLSSWHLAQGQAIDHWETAVFKNDTWRYFVGTSEPDANWRSLSFNEESWAQGTGGFGYSDNDDNTTIPQSTSVFLRALFIVPDTALIANALLSMDYDDAFVAYLNDVEIARAGITGIHPTFDQTGIDHEAKMYTGGLPESFIINKNQLKTCLFKGQNVLAIQVHNSSPSSSDLSSNAFLSFGIVNSTIGFRPFPSWFTAPLDFSSSNLPIVIINTDGGMEIPDEPRVLANMKIIYRGEGLRNYLTDQNTPEYLNYNGRIDIEIRGSSSQYLEKKQYGLSTKKADSTSSSNVSLLGLPGENDWILSGLAFDPSLIRNYLSYNLSRMIGEYASRTVFCEVMINDVYKGLYLLLEKIKSGPDRININEIGSWDNTFPAVTGGYITKADKTTGGDPIAWTMSSYLGINDVGFIHELPKPENVTSEQNAYIRSEFVKLSSTVSAGNLSLESGYPSVIDIPSFVDYMILNELAANADAYQYSTFYHKDRNGKLRAGPLWDLDLTYGNDLFIWNFDRSKTDAWQFSNGDNEGPKFWRDLFNNTKFKCYLSKRWNQLIQPGQPLNFSGVEQFIDQTVAAINEAAVRENALWGTIGDHANEILKLKTFLQQRISWITNNIGSYSACSNVETPPLVITKIMYDPISTVDFPNSKDQEYIEIKNTGNNTVILTGVYFSGTGFVYQFPVNSLIGPNATKILASNPLVFTAKHGFSPSGQFTRNLSNTGENLVLVDGFGNVIDNVLYSNLPPWPNANANGYSLELTDPLSDNSIATNWSASTPTIVSVEDAEKDLLLKFYPSPVRDNLIIESTGRKYILQLFDFQSCLLQAINVNSDTYSLDMSSYFPGIYLVKIITPDGSFIRKIIKE